MTVKVAIVSDTHGFVDPRVIELVNGCDYAVHAGDIGSRGVLKTLAKHAGDVVAVRGNNDIRDKWARGEWAHLNKIPEEACLPLPGGELMVIHGHQAPCVDTRHARLRARFPAARVIVYGHSHHLCDDRESNPWVLNPGAAGRTHTFGGPSCLILRAGPRKWDVQAHRFPPD